MTTRLQIVLIVASLLFFLSLIRIIRKSKLSTDMGTAWVIWGIGLVIISLFPQIAYFVSNLIGIQSPINAIFLFMIFFLYCLSFYMFVKVSILEEKFKNLVQEVSLREFNDKKS